MCIRMSLPTDGGMEGLCLEWAAADTLCWRALISHGWRRKISLSALIYGWFVAQMQWAVWPTHECCCSSSVLLLNVMGGWTSHSWTFLSWRASSCSHWHGSKDLITAGKWLKCSGKTSGAGTCGPLWRSLIKIWSALLCIWKCSWESVRCPETRLIFLSLSLFYVSLSTF